MIQTASNHSSLSNITSNTHRQFTTKIDICQDIFNIQLTKKAQSFSFKKYISNVRMVSFDEEVNKRVSEIED